MTTDGVAVARSFLDRMEMAIAARDLAALRQLCTQDVDLFGTARANFGLEDSSNYLQMVVHRHTIRWFLDRWSVVHHDDDQLLVAASGQVESDDGTERERVDFRLTLWLVRHAGDWKSNTSMAQSPCRRDDGRGHARHDRSSAQSPWVGGSGAGGHVGGEDVVGVAIEVLAGSVVARGGSGIGVAGGDLHVPLRLQGVDVAVGAPGEEHTQIRSRVLAGEALEPTEIGGHRRSQNQWVTRLP